jgi:hypothetical protein
MLTLFIVSSGKDNANIEKTTESLSGVQGSIVPISSWWEINDYQNKDDWFGIFWDNEYIDNNLREALPIYFLYQAKEALILYKKVSMVDAIWRYRFFRRSIYLGEDFSPLSFWLNKEIVLDGWVLEHDYPS